MPRYHITYKENVNDFYSKGQNINADDEIAAICQFRRLTTTILFSKATKSAIFLSMVCIDNISALTKAQLDNDSKHGFTPSSH